MPRLCPGRVDGGPEKTAEASRLDQVRPNPNVAERIEGLAATGGLSVSHPVIFTGTLRAVESGGRLGPDLPKSTSSDAFGYPADQS